MNKPLPLFQVDAFTDQPFAGNSAAVCLQDGRVHLGGQAVTIFCGERHA